MGIYSPVITCFEEFGTQKENLNVATSPEASVTLRCAWADRHALVQDLLANQRPWPNGTAVNPPLAQRAAIKTFDTAYTVVGQSIIYNTAIVEVNYGYEARDLFSESLEPTADFVTLDHRFFRWIAADGEPLKQGEAPGKLRRGLNFVRTLFNVSPPLSTQLLTAVGGVNNAPYASTSLGLTFPTETLLYTPPNITLTVDTLGSDGYTIAMKFMYRPEEWNKFWHAKTQDYEEIFLVGGVKYESYPLVDMSDLL